VETQHTPPRLDLVDDFLRGLLRSPILAEVPSASSEPRRTLISLAAGEDAADVAVRTP
jgi:hypothetical protein